MYQGTLRWISTRTNNTIILGEESHSSVAKLSATTRVAGTPCMFDICSFLKSIQFEGFGAVVVLRRIVFSSSVIVQVAKY
jgi:hypothetical protein